MSTPIEESEIDAVIAQVRKTVAAIKAAHARGASLTDAERDALRIDQQTAAAMLVRMVEHRQHPSITDAQALEMATVFAELREFDKQTGQPEPPIEDIIAGADRLLKLRKPDAH